jgi:hypothetical protein
MKTDAIAVSGQICSVTNFSFIALDVNLFKRCFIFTSRKEFQFAVTIEHAWIAIMQIKWAAGQVKN